MLSMGEIAVLNGTVTEGFTEKVTKFWKGWGNNPQSHVGKEFFRQRIQTVLKLWSRNVWLLSRLLTLHTELFATISPLYSVPAFVENQLWEENLIAHPLAMSISSIGDSYSQSWWTPILHIKYRYLFWDTHLYFWEPTDISSWISHGHLTNNMSKSKLIIFLAKPASPPVPTIPVTPFGNPLIHPRLLPLPSITHPVCYTASRHSPFHIRDTYGS